MNDDHAALQNFQGVAKLFPLPGLVFFPHTAQPLHIFEPRYRQMMADALDADRLLALVLLQAGWDKNYDHQPAIHPVACLGRIVAEQRLPDGRYNLILRGLARIRIEEELVTGKLYRQARVTVQEDAQPTAIDELIHARRDLAQVVLPRFTTDPLRTQVEALFHGEMPLGQLCDVLTFALPLPPETKQLLLETNNVVERAKQLMTAFQAAVDAVPKAKTSSKFPPDFSVN